MGGKKPQSKNVKGNPSFKHRSNTNDWANEVFSMCALESALVLLSLDGKTPPSCPTCVKAVVKMMVNNDRSGTEFARHLAHHEAEVKKLNEEYVDALKELDTEIKRGKELEELGRILNGKSPLDIPIDNLNQRELDILRSHLERVTEYVFERIDKHKNNPNQEASSSDSNWHNDAS